MAETAAAFAAAGSQLVQRHIRRAAAITGAMPDHRAGGVSRLQRILRRQQAEALASDVPLPGLYFCSAAAIRGCAALQRPGIEQDLPAAAAPAAPDDIPVFPLRRRRGGFQIAAAKSDRDRCLSHPEPFFCRSPATVSRPGGHNFSYVVDADAKNHEIAKKRSIQKTGCSAVGANGQANEQWNSSALSTCLFLLCNLSFWFFDFPKS